MREGERQPVRLGISTCLLGERVRYDGGHKRDAFLVDTLPHSSSGCRPAGKSRRA